MHVEPKPQWTPEQGRRYELLRETIALYVGNVMAELHAHNGATTPRAGVIAALHAHLADVHQERKALSITDDAQISATMAKFDALNRAFNLPPAH